MFIYSILFLNEHRQIQSNFDVKGDSLHSVFTVKGVQIQHLREIDPVEDNNLHLKYNFSIVAHKSSEQPQLSSRVGLN